MEQNELARIVAQAGFIGERAHENFEPNLRDEQLIAARLDAWAQAVSDKAERQVLERLWTWDGISEATARAMVAPVTLRADAPLPEWANFLATVLQEKIPDDAPAFLQADKPIAFEEILAPFVFAVLRELQTQCGWSRLDVNAQNQIAYNLLNALSAFATEPLFLEFQAFRNRQPFGALAAVVAKTGAAPGTSLYQKFVAQQRAGGLRALLGKYPVLARLLASQTLTRLEVLREFLQQLDADADAIGETFNNGSAPGKVQSLSLGLSDAHHGGHGVIGIEFESGLHLIYKPKDLAAEAAYNALLEWLNARGAPMELRALTVLNRETYGWVTFAEHSECADADAVGRYYYRVGMLLALTYALEGTDCHLENLIASGEHPVLIDNETLFHHRVPEETSQETKNSALFAAYEKMDGSVLRVGLLPGWRVGKDRKVAYDSSGLGAFGDQIVPFRNLRVTHPNTDAMQMSLQQGHMRQQANVPMLNGAPARLEEHVEQVKNGFRDMYDFLLTQRDALLAQDSPLYLFRHAKVRFIFRSTQIYASLLKQAQQPVYLRDGAEYSLYLERIARAHVQVENKPACFPLLASERAGLARNDIPFFAARTDSAALQLDEANAASVENYFTGPSFELAVERLRALSAEDCAWQMSLIETALHSRVASVEYSTQQNAPSDGSAPTQTIARPGAAEYLAHAIEIAEKIRATAIRGEDGSAAWFGPEYMPISGRYQISILSFNLYDGLTGIGLFLAALARATGDATWRELALSAFHSTRESLIKDFDSLVEHGGVGGTNGVPAAVYALLRAGLWLDEAALLDEAHAATAKLSRAHIEKDKARDIISGSAGGILGLLAFYHATGDANALARAIDCGEHLLNERMVTQTGQRAWTGISHYALSGFSHGAAGFAYALLQLARASGREDFRAAALEALAYEDALFSIERQNWPDLRDDFETQTPADLNHLKYVVAWCHGASGIGMGRVDALNILDTPDMRHDIDAALSSTVLALQEHLDSADHICCGNFGRIEFLLTAGQVLERPELVAQAHGFAAQVVALAQAQGGYRFAHFLPRGTFGPGLFQGGAGIGYEFLRLAQPELFPNLLLWK